MLVFSKEKMIEVIGKNAYEAGKALADEMGIEMPYDKMDMMPIEENKNETSDNFDESLSEIIDGLRLLQKYGHIM